MSDYMKSDGFGVYENEIQARCLLVSVCSMNCSNAAHCFQLASISYWASVV